MGWNLIAPWKLQVGKAQVVAVGAAHAESTALGAYTNAVLLSSTTNCHVRIGRPGLAAVATDTLIKASDPPIVLGCAPGDEVSVIQDAAAGNLSITELTH